MSDQDQGEYDLAEVPEPRQPRAPVTPGQPLPRLWKAEPDEDEEEERKTAAEAKKKQEAAAQSAAEAARAAEARHRARTAKPKESKKPAAGEGSEKKVLVEETPALDTYEARQRGRLIVGALVFACIGIFGWIFYKVFLYDANPTVASEDEPPPPVVAAPAPKRDLDLEAQNMFNRAREDAQAGRTKEAVTLLEIVVKSYKGTRTADEASKALERPKQNLPLFLDRPVLKAEAAPKPPAPGTQPTQVVTAEPKQTAGNAILTLPANPAELTPTHPSPLAMATTNPGAGKTPATVRSLPGGFTAKIEAGIHGSGWPLAIVGNRDGASMVLVPGGTFTMGNDNASPAEAPAHKVSLSTYYIDQHEVTIRQFRLFLSESHYRGQPLHIGDWSEDFRKNTSESLPMVMVNARDAQAYAEWALKQLPTEAQWEMAARSTDGRLYPWGSEPIKQAKSRALGQVEPVMTVPDDASPYGVHDLGGSVLEWTKDWYDSKYYHQLFPPVVNPTGPSAKPRSLELVVKGDRKSGSASFRQGIMLEKRLTYVGFRCVLPVEDKGGAVSPGSPVPPPSPGQPPANPARPGNPQAPNEPF